MFFICLFAVCLAVGACVPQHMCGHQRSACGSGFSPSAMWVPKLSLGCDGWQMPFLSEPCRLLFYLFVLESLNISQCVHVCVNVCVGVHSHHVCGGERIISGASHLPCVGQGRLFFASVQEAKGSKASRIPAFLPSPSLSVCWE